MRGFTACGRISQVEKIEMTRASKQYEYMSLDDFEELLADKPADEKWELIGGRVVRMSRGDNAIVTAALLIGLRGKGSDCRPFFESFWLKRNSLNLACFPDGMVRRGPLSDHAKSLDDPIVIAEVVTKGSAQRDLGEKFGLYRRLPSLEHYVLIECDSVSVDVYSRSGGGFFIPPQLSEIDDVLRLPAIDFETPLCEIYRDVIPAAS